MWASKRARKTCIDVLPRAFDATSLLNYRRIDPGCCLLITRLNVVRIVSRFI